MKVVLGAPASGPGLLGFPVSPALPELGIDAASGSERTWARLGVRLRPALRQLKRPWRPRRGGRNSRLWRGGQVLTWFYVKPAFFSRPVRVLFECHSQELPENRRGGRRRGRRVAASGPGRFGREEAGHFGIARGLSLQEPEGGAAQGGLFSLRPPPALQGGQIGRAHV